MFLQKQKNACKRAWISFSILWMLICPEIYWQGEFSCIQRADGKEISQQEANEILKDIVLHQEEAAQQGITYKCKIVEWLEARGYITDSGK